MMRITGVSILAILVATACGGDAAGPPADLNGDWAWSETYADTAHGMSCSFVGSITVVQSGATFSGSWSGTESCSTPSGPQSGTAAGDVASGAVSGSSVSFVAPPPDWHYQGAISGDSANRLSGTLLATFVYNSVTYRYVGNWQATR
jgi:hypothetical protein